MVRLSVNVNKVATLRNARGGERPEVLGRPAFCRTVFGAGHQRDDLAVCCKSEPLDQRALVRRVHIEFGRQERRPGAVPSGQSQ